MTDATNPTVDADGRMLSDAAANLKLYDTASHAVEPFVPVQPGHVGIYVCAAGCCVWAIRSRSCAT